MSRRVAGLGLALLTAGCASAPPGPERSEVIRRLLPSTVLLRAERDSGGHRAGSGVVLASDAATGRSWILTTRHLLGGPGRQEVSVRPAGGGTRIRGEVAAVSPDLDLALVEVRGLVLPPVGIKRLVRLGDGVWVIAFPWGRRPTVVSGIVSQLVAEEGDTAVEGAPHMVDASVSYGSSGGGVFDAESGALVGIVEGYRTAQMATPRAPGQLLQLPVPGETTLIPARAILCFLLRSGLDGLAPAETPAGAPGPGAPACPAR